jgi:tRNA 2-thiouridine synthesizing protein A
MVDQVLDTKGLNCPIPIVKAKKALQGMDSGQVLEVLATDPGAVKDFEAFSRKTQNEILDWNEDDGVYTFHIKRV